MQSRRMKVVVSLAAVSALAGGGPAAGAPARVAWGTTPSAPAGTLGELAAVAAVPGQAWAVGGFNPGEQPTSVLTRPYAEHWDGHAWASTPVPLGTVYQGGVQGARLEGVSAASASDVWAVGTVENRSSLAAKTLTYHWDGTRWTRVASPNPAGRSLGNRLHAVAARNTTAVYAVGDQGYPAASLVLRWNGSAWTRLTAPDIGRLISVAVDPGTVWVASLTAVQSFDGSRWTRLPSLPVTSGSLQLSGLAKASTGLWAVGTEVIPFFEGYLYRPYAAVWNGTSWTQAVPAPGSGSSGYSAVTAFGGQVLATSGGAVTRLATTGASLEVTPMLGSAALAGVTTDGAGSSWAVGRSGRLPSIITAPSTTQGGISVVTGYSGATVTWIGPASGSGAAATSGLFETGGLVAGSYTVLASAPGCAPAVVAGVTVAAGSVASVDARVTC